MPSPPPPYSPPPSRDMATTLRSSPAMASSPFASTHVTSPNTIPSEHDLQSNVDTQSIPGTSSGLLQIRPSSSQVVPHSPVPGRVMTFAPPPPLSRRGRSSSRTNFDKQHSLWSLSALTSRNRPSEPTAPPDAPGMARQHSTDVIFRASNSLNTAPTPTETLDLVPQPPNARRAASTGGIGIISAPARNRAPSTSQTPWEPGMPLPPPPPGPPPSNVRSQSMNRASEPSYSASPTSLVAPAARWPRPHHGSGLDPVPPTPADWTEEHSPSQSPPSGQSQSNVPRESNHRPTVTNSDRLSLHTDLHASETLGNHKAPRVTSILHDSHQSASAPNSGLTRAPARLELSARGIRERRSESRAARERTLESQGGTEASNNPWAQDLQTSLVSS